MKFEPVKFEPKEQFSKQFEMNIGNICITLYSAVLGSMTRQDGTRDKQ